MQCPDCGHPEQKVLETRASGDGIRRRRQCLSCGHRFTTHERLELRVPMVVKKDGDREPFDRDKVMSGLRLACRKRPVTSEQLEAATDAVEHDLAERSVPEVPSVEVGRLVLEELRRLDKVAFLRFASVYQEVDTPEQFLELLRPWADGSGRSEP